MENKEIIKKSIKKKCINKWTFLATYPFISSSIFDDNGIFIGTNIYNNSLVFIDRYNTKNIKTQIFVFLEQVEQENLFYTKLLILRYKLLGIKQYIIDPDREYNEICEKIRRSQNKVRGQHLIHI